MERQYKKRQRGPLGEVIIQVDSEEEGSRMLRAVTRIAREGMPSRRLGIRIAKIMITILTRSMG
jgi:hypothetical protein